MLAFACAFTMFAGAASFTDEADISENNRDAVELLTTLKIIKGYEDGSFDPEGTVDRAEMAKMIYTIRNGGNDDASAHVGNTTSFTDISGHWAEGYIKYLQNTGIVAGKSATQFAPDAQVTTAEAMKMALALAGYDEKNAGLTGIDWQKNTLTYATTIGLTDDVNSAMSAGCTRQDAAQILANVLGATAVRYSAVVENFVNDSKEGLSFGGDPISVGNKWMDLYTNIGTLVGIDGDKLTITMTQSDEADSDDKDIKNFIDLDTDYSDLLGQKVKVLFENGKNNAVIGVYATVDNTVYTVEANDTSKDEEKVAFGDSSYRLDDKGGIVTYVDGNAKAQWTSLDQLDSNALNPNMYTFVDTDDNGRLDTLVVRTYDVAKVSYVSSDRVIAAGHTYKYDDEIIADGIEKGDWVVITKDLYNDCWNLETVDVQSADLDAMRDDQKVKPYFDGQKIGNEVTYDEYQIGDNWYNGAAALQDDRSESDLNNVKAVQAVDYVAVNGIMFYVERSSGTNTGRVDNVAVVLAVSDHSAVADQARIAFMNGDTKVVDIDDKSEKQIDDGLTVGGAYEFNIVGGECRFSDLKQGVGAGNEDYEEYYGDLSYRGDMNATALTSGTFNGVKISDDAQILLYWATDATSGEEDWDVVSITGKQFKALQAQGLTDIDKTTSGDQTVEMSKSAYGFSGDMGGLNRIGALALQVTDKTNLSGIGIPTWNHYGYIMESAKWVSELNRIAQYKMFSDGHIYTVQEEIRSLNLREKGMVIGFDELNLNSDAVVVRAVVETTEDGVYDIEGAVVLNGDNAGLKFSAVVDKGGDTVVFSNGEEVDISGATIIYIDSQSNIALTDGDIDDAMKLSNSKYAANALYIGQDGGDCELLVIDQGTYLKSDYYKALAETANTQYGDEVAKDDEEDNSGTSTTGNFTVNVSDTTLFTETGARRTDSGEAEFQFTTPDYVTKGSFDYAVKIGGVTVDSKNDVSFNGGEVKTTTSGADIASGDQVVIELSDFKVTEVSASGDTAAKKFANFKGVTFAAAPAITTAKTNAPISDANVVVNAADASADGNYDMKDKTLNVTVTLTGATFDADGKTTAVVEVKDIDNSSGAVNGDKTVIPAFTANGESNVTLTVSNVAVAK